MDLHSGQRARITGASKGIGRASATLLAAQGCGVVRVARDPATLEQAAIGTSATVLTLQGGA